ncbi:MAG TPA: hypothetical protein VMU66_10515 [Gaiellales bacterium]|nr:hypothetical protein [Gaiellales bacterium]
MIILPSLEEALDRSRRGEKRVLEEHTCAQHARCAEWGEAARIDTTGLSVE